MCICTYMARCGPIRGTGLTPRFHGARGAYMWIYILRYVYLYICLCICINIYIAATAAISG